MKPSNTFKRKTINDSESSCKQIKKFDRKGAKKEADRYVTLGLNYQEAQKYGEARNEFNKALNAYANYSDALYNIALLNIDMMESTQCSTEQQPLLANEAIGCLNIIIANDTSKRGELTGLSYRVLANILLDFKGVFIGSKTSVDPSTRTHFAQIQSNYEAALAILQTAKERDTYILEYAQFLHGCLSELLDSTLHSASSSVSSPDCTTMATFHLLVSRAQRVLQVLDSALQTPFSSNIDAEVLGTRGELLSDVWDGLFDSFPQFLGRNGFTSAPQALSQPIQGTEGGAAVYTVLESLAVDTVKVCRSLEALLSVTDPTAHSLHLILDLNMSLLAWSRANGNAMESEHRLKYFVDVQCVLCGGLRARLEAAAAISSGQLLLGAMKYALDVISQLGDNLASLAVEVRFMEASGEEAVLSALRAGLDAMAFARSLEQCVLSLANSAAAQGSLAGSATASAAAAMLSRLSGVDFLASGGLLLCSRECYSLSLSVWALSVSLLNCTKAETSASGNSSSGSSNTVIYPDLLHRIEVSGLCDQEEVGELASFLSTAIQHTAHHKQSTQFAQESSTSGSSEEEEDEEVDMREVLFNQACTEWRLQSPRGCCLALLRYIVLDCALRGRLEAPAVAVPEGLTESSELFRDVLRDRDLSGIQNTEWFAPLFQLYQWHC